MFHLPTATHSARELIDVAHVATVPHPDNRAVVPAVWQARILSQRYFAAEPTARRVAYIVCRYDSGQYWLITFGRKGGWRKEWNFGSGA